MRLLCMLTFSGPASWPQLLQPGDGRISGGAAATLCGRNRSDRLATSGLEAAAAVRLERLKLGQLRLEGPNGLGFLQQQADGGETAPGLLELGNTDFHPGKVYPLLEKLKNTNNYCGLESSVGPVQCCGSLETDPNCFTLIRIRIFVFRFGSGQFLSGLNKKIYSTNQLVRS